MIFMSKDKFSFVLCPGRNPKSEYHTTYNEIFSCWQNLWSKAYQEMQVSKHLYSDNFTRQDFIGAVYYAGKCVGVICFRWCDIGTNDFANDSAFAQWGPEDLKKISERGPKVIVCSQLTVHPLARGKTLGVSVMHLLTGLGIEFFMNANAHAMAAHIRIDKKVNESCARLGGTSVRENVHFSGGIAGDLMVFYKDVIAQRPTQELDILVKQLWNNQTMIPQENETQEKYFIPSATLRKVA